MTGLAIQNLSKKYLAPDGAEVWAVRDVSLSAQPEEFVVLVGPSGSGKTTLLRLIAGLEEPDGGTIAIGGKVVNRLPPHERDVAMAFQDQALYPHMNVRENLSFGLKLRKCERPVVEKRTAAMAELLGLTHLLDRTPGSLSGGERQRVALGRAAVLGPKILLLDEPLSNLDAPLRSQLRRELVRLRRKMKVMVLYVTHDQVEAMSLGDRVAVLHQGGIQQVGSPMQVYDRPANLFVAGFIGSPAMNFIKGNMEREGGAWRFRSSTGAGEEQLNFVVSDAEGCTRALSPGLAVVAGFRPEHLHWSEGDGAGGARVRGRVDMVEPLGSESLVHVETEAGVMVVRAAPECAVRSGQDVRIAFQTNRAHFFDAVAGNNLRPMIES
ncbi:MAG: ABC transporter ATP-binding protein [Verrucomicrobiota bacterium]